MQSLATNSDKGSFCGMTFLSLYLLGQFKALHRPYTFVKLVPCTLPMLAAFLVAISRVVDYRHHPEDVIVGAIVGIGFGYLGYRMYLPALDDLCCHEVAYDDYYERVLTHSGHDNSAMSSRMGSVDTSAQSRSLQAV
jgi:diacylglycerol diphosphate phosphatase/phosphatidate phosphatase